MKTIILIIFLSLLITSCSDSENVNENIKALNGTWSSMCHMVDEDKGLSGDYGIYTYEFNNGNYTHTFSPYSDINCINEVTDTQKEIGITTFIEEVITQSGLTASKVQFEVISSYLNKPPTYETLIYIDSNNLYFGAFLDDFNVILLSDPHMKVN